MARGTRQSVAVVVYHTWVRRVLADALEEAGYAVVSCSNGASGLRLSAAHRPQAVLLGLDLPELDALSVIRGLRREDATRHIPVVLVAARDDFVAEGMICDPYRSRDIVAQVARATARAHAARPRQTRVAAVYRSPSAHRQPIVGARRSPGRRRIATVCTKVADRNCALSPLDSVESEGII
jgi:DNA-binding response OmpR family regulator